MRQPRFGQHRLTVQEVVIVCCERIAPNVIVQVLAPQHLECWALVVPMFARAWGTRTPSAARTEVQACGVKVTLQPQAVGSNRVQVHGL